MKIIAYYLPQFHEIPENNEWWEEGFTEWVNVKKAKPIFEGHKQPRVPLNKNYYNLLNDNVKIWQANLAREYGIYGFCYYHYWFNGKLLLEKPMEQMLKNKKIDIPFCICWANEEWSKAWVGEPTKVLMPQLYGDKKEWKEHFEYLLPFFKDERYIKIEGKPLFVIYRPAVISCAKDMFEYWQELATENGLSGICFASQAAHMDSKFKDEKIYDYNIEFQPGYARREMLSSNKGIISSLKKIRKDIALIIEKKFGIDILRIGADKFRKATNSQIISYDDIWNKILELKPNNEKKIPGAFVRWDNTPRHGKRGYMYSGESPEKFERYLSEQIKNAKNIYNKDFIFMYAWNEWAEGGYLEPDEEYEYQYLEAVKKALLENNEFPRYN